MKAIDKIISAAVLVMAAGVLTVTISASIDAAADQPGAGSATTVTTLAGGAEWG